MSKLTNLFSPIKIGSMELKNRIVMPPMATAFGSIDGAVTRRLIDYHVERARGGVAMIIVEGTSIDSPLGNFSHTALRLDNDAYITGFNDLAEAVHLEGAKLAVQLNHAGRATNTNVTGGVQPVSSSDVPCVPRGGYPRPLRVEEIENIVEKFGKAAERAKRAGADAVEFHGAHGYLIANFLSPYTNKRSDKYGGDFNRRMKFALDIIECTRGYVGKDFPLSFRISGEEYIDGGLTISDTKKISKMLQVAGVDVIHVSATVPESKFDYMTSSSPHGCMVDLAAAIKSELDIPVIAVGRITDPILAEQIITECKADLVAFGRALLADPELPKKAFEGRFEDIRKCTACLRGCVSRIHANRSIRCSVNAQVGREREYVLKRAEIVKKVVVVGGGVAGLEAARVAKLRGHEVILFEKSNELGGQINIAALAPFKNENFDTIKYFSTQLKKLGVRIQLGEEVTQEILKELKPDVVIIATGAIPLIPKISGVEQNNVVTAWDALKNKVTVGQNVIIIGGGMVGLETAEFFVEKGKNIVLVEMLPDVGLDMPTLSKNACLRRLQNRDVKIIVNLKVKEIFENGIKAVDNSETEKTINADTIILAVGAVPYRPLKESFMFNIPEVYLIGDCMKPRNAQDAIHEGYYVALKI